MSVFRLHTSHCTQKAPTNQCSHHQLLELRQKEREFHYGKEKRMQAKFTKVNALADVVNTFRMLSRHKCVDETVNELLKTRLQEE